MNFMKLIPILSLALVIGACSSSQKKPAAEDLSEHDTGINAREIFESHWKDHYKSVKVLDVTYVSYGGYFKGHGIADEHPVEEYYDPKTRNFTRTPPATTSSGYSDNTRELTYEEFMATFGKELGEKLDAEDARMAVLEFPSEKKNLTELSTDLASKVEMGLINSGKHVVDRSTLAKVMDEHKLQQKDGVMFDNATIARIGKFSGANMVIHGSYSMLDNQYLIITAKAVSVETTKVVSVKQGKFPLTGEGSASRSLIMKMAETRDSD